MANLVKSTRLFPNSSLTILFAALYSVTHLIVGQGLELTSTFCALFIAGPLIWISVCDWRSFEIPDIGIGALVAATLLVLTLQPPEAILSHAITALGIGALTWALGELHYRSKGHEGIGIGDAKLFAASGFLLGPLKLPDLVFLSSVGGIIVCLIAFASTGSLKRGMAFGPFIAYATFIMLHSDPLFL